LIDTIFVSHGDGHPVQQVSARAPPRPPRAASPAPRHEVHRAGQGRCHLSRARAADGGIPWVGRRGRHAGATGEKGPALILVDSSGWIEYLADRPLARRFATYLEGREPLLVSAIEVYEVYKVIRRDVSEERALAAVAALRRATIAPVDESLALEAADVSLAHGLAMADSLVYATARRHGAKLVTADADFEDLADAIVVS
jgi:toxin FitB